MENRLTGFVPWVLPVGDELGHMSVDPRRALDAGLTLRPLARTTLDVMDWWASIPESLRQDVRFPLSPEREREMITAWRARG
jgi:2'-hydroxyisoflavone reductase